MAEDISPALKNWEGGHNSEDGGRVLEKWGMGAQASQGIDLDQWMQEHWEKKNDQAGLHQRISKAMWGLADHLQIKYNDGFRNENPYYMDPEGGRTSTKNNLGHFIGYPVDYVGQVGVRHQEPYPVNVFSYDRVQQLIQVATTTARMEETMRRHVAAAQEIQVATATARMEETMKRHVQQSSSSGAGVTLGQPQAESKAEESEVKSEESVINALQHRLQQLQNDLSQYKQQLENKSAESMEEASENRELGAELRGVEGELVDQQRVITELKQVLNQEIDIGNGVSEAAVNVWRTLSKPKEANGEEETHYTDRTVTTAATLPTQTEGQNESGNTHLLVSFVAGSAVGITLLSGMQQIFGRRTIDERPLLG